MEILFLDNWHTLSDSKGLYPNVEEFLHEQSQKRSICVVSSGSIKHTQTSLATVRSFIDHFACQEDFPVGKNLKIALEYFQMLHPEEKFRCVMIGNEVDKEAALTLPGTPLILVRNSDWISQVQANGLLETLFKDPLLQGVYEVS